MSDNKNVISIGDGYWRYPRKFWGSLDRKRAARAEQQASHTDEFVLGGQRPLLPDHVTGSTWSGHTAEDKARQTRHSLARFEEKFGYRKRETW
jgi:hypothetical protein